MTRSAYRYRAISSEPSVPRAAVLAVSGLVALALPGCFEPAESYCGDLYAEDGVGTPRWATEAGYFHDYETCVEWYRDNEPGPYER
jgi:hypothetical protein